MDKNDRYKLMESFVTATNDLSDWMKAEKTARELSVISCSHWQAFKDATSEKVTNLVHIGQKLLEDDELQERFREPMETRMEWARHFEESLVP